MGSYSSYVSPYLVLKGFRAPDSSTKPFKRVKGLLYSGLPISDVNADSLVCLDRFLV